MNPNIRDTNPKFQNTIKAINQQNEDDEAPQVCRDFDDGIL